MEINKNIKDCINSLKECINKDNSNNYCIIVYSIHRDINVIKYIYKNINEFENKVESDIKNIDSMYGINFQLWEYD